MLWTVFIQSKMLTTNRIITINVGGWIEQFTIKKSVFLIFSLIRVRIKNEWLRATEINVCQMHDTKREREAFDDHNLPLAPLLNILIKKFFAQTFPSWTNWVNEVSYAYYHLGWTSKTWRLSHLLYAFSHKARVFESEKQKFLVTTRFTLLDNVTLLYNNP